MVLLDADGIYIQLLKSDRALLLASWSELPSYVTPVLLSLPHVALWQLRDALCPTHLRPTDSLQCFPTAEYWGSGAKPPSHPNIASPSFVLEHEGQVKIWDRIDWARARVKSC